MRKAFLCGVPAAVAAFLLLLSPAQGGHGSACTAAQKHAAQKALAAYRKAMPKQRARYFRSHKRAAQRRAFVRKQKAKLKRLKAAAACTVPAPDTSPPTVTITSHPPSPSNTTSGTFAFSADEAASFQCRFDSAGFAPCSSPEAYTDLSEGPHTFAVQATDTAGNTGEPVTFSWTIDATAPPLLDAKLSGTQITLRFDEPLAGVSDTSVTADGANLQVASSAVSGSSLVLALGSAVGGDPSLIVHTTVTDPAGNETALPAQAVTNANVAGFSPALQKAAWADDRGSSSPDYGEWPIDRTYFLSPTHVRVLMLFIDFPDVPATLTPSQLYDTWAPVTESWYRHASYGRFDLGIDYRDHVYRMPSPSTSYGPLSSGGGGPLESFVVAATHLADPDVDYSKYDAVWIAALGDAHLPTSALRLWPENAITLDGKRLQHFEVAQGFILDHPVEELGHPMDNAGAANLEVTHELGHHLGTPDSSYKPDPQTPYDFSFVGGWDLQDSPAGLLHGADYFAWNKWRMGWLDATQVRGLTGPGTVETTVSPVESPGGVKMIAAQVSPSFLYAVEVRRKLGNDAGSTCDEGVLVYSVDSTKRNGQGPVFVYPARPSTDAARIATCGLKYAAPFGVGPGQVSTFENADVKVEVLGTDGTNYRVRMTRK